MSPFLRFALSGIGTLIIVGVAAWWAWGWQLPGATRDQYRIIMVGPTPDQIAEKVKELIKRP
jgi:hypothetical protein